MKTKQKLIHSQVAVMRASVK